MSTFKTISAIVIMSLILLVGLVLLNLLLVKLIILVFSVDYKFNELTAASIIASSITTTIILVSILYGQGAFN